MPRVSTAPTLLTSSIRQLIDRATVDGTSVARTIRPLQASGSSVSWPPLSLNPILQRVVNNRTRTRAPLDVRHSGFLRFLRAHMRHVCLPVQTTSYDTPEALTSTLLRNLFALYIHISRFNSMNSSLCHQFLDCCKREAFHKLNLKKLLACISMLTFPA